MKMNKKVFRCILAIAGYILLSCSQLLSQPYYFYLKPIDERNLSIYRLDLNSGTEERFTDDLFRAAELEWDATQTWLYVYQDYGPALVINIGKSSIRDTLPKGKNIERVYHIFYVPQLKRFYISWTCHWGSDTVNTTIYSSETFDSLGTVDETVGEGGILSRDGTKLYYVDKDTLDNIEYLYTFSTISNTVSNGLRFLDIGPQAHVKAAEDGKLGEILIRYYYPSSGNENTYYFLYDIESRRSYTPIHSPFRSYAFLSGDAEKIIIEQVNFDKTLVGGEYHTGNINIFDASTGVLIQQLSLSPGGKVLVFDNYPSMMYYYLPAEGRSININLDSIAAVNSSPKLVVKLINSAGTRLTTGSLQYYEGSWKDATNNNDGTFTINTTAKTLSLRMTYEYGTQTKSNVTVGTDTAVFQMVNAQIKLQDSKGNPLDTGTVQYYAGAWRNLGATINGIATKELLPNSYSFRMTYAYGSNDRSQDIGVNPTIVFQTVNSAVQLQDSHGTLMPAPLGDQGTVQYYSGAWRDFGTTSSGVTSKELLPNTYSFRMTYAYASNDKQQNIGTDPTVVFQTVNATVQLKNSQGNLIDTGTVQYYAGAWRAFGTTTGGLATKELLPNNYSFRMTYAFVSNDKAQDISTNSAVAFSTVLCTINVTNSQSQPVNNVQASYYSGAWWQIGPTVNGQVTKELLPANLTFRITYGTSHQDKTQNLATNNVVGFSIP